MATARMRHSCTPSPLVIVYPARLNKKNQTKPRVVEGAVSSPPPGLCVLLLTPRSSEYSPFCTAYAGCSPLVVRRHASPGGTCLTSEQPAMVQGRKEVVEELFCRHMVPNVSFSCLLPFASSLPAPLQVSFPCLSSVSEPWEGDACDFLSCLHGGCFFSLAFGIWPKPLG